MAGPRKSRVSRRAPRRRASRPVLGNDPFERGAAERPAAPARPTGGPRAEEAAARAARLEAEVDRALAGAERRVSEAVRRSGALDLAAEARETLAKLLPALVERLRALGQLLLALEGPGSLDPWGMDARLAARAEPLLDFLVDSWWRVEVRGADRIPQGAALVVANRGGTLPWDALVLRRALLRDPVRRELRPLVDEGAAALPVLGKALVRLGAVVATPEAAQALLSRGHLVGVFPEGSRPEKAWGDRYKIRRFGRGGFAKVAVRARVPIVPCAIVGSEEATPPPARAGWLAERLGLPLLSLAPAVPLGPLAWLPLPSRWSIRFGDPLETAGLGPAAAEEPPSVAQLTERVRAELQRMLDEDVAARRSVFL